MHGETIETLPKRSTPTLYAGEEDLHAAASESSASVRIPQYYRYEGTNRPSGIQTIFMIFGILLLLLCAFALLLLLLKDRNTDTKIADNETTAADTLEAEPTQTRVLSRTSNESAQEAVTPYETICEVCGAVIPLTDEMLARGTVTCPQCGTELEFVPDGDNADAAAAPEIEEPESEREPEPQPEPEPEPELVQEPEPVQIPEEVVDLSPFFSSAYASSVLSDTTSHTYQADKTIDGDLTTCWAEGADGTGIGESLTLYADHKQRLNSIVIYNGLCTDEELFYKNRRVKECRIEFSDQTYLDVTLNEDYWSQPSVIPFDTIDTDYIRLTILSTYSGNKYEDTCISEIEVRNY